MDTFVSNIQCFNFSHCSLGKEYGETLLYYKGAFDIEILAKIGIFIRKKITDFPRASKRLFSNFIELTQNISYYSSETNIFFNPEPELKKSGIGSLVIYDTGNSYSLSAGNLIRKNNTQKIIERCKKINGLNKSELRNLKKQYLNAPKNKFQKGGNIGLIQVALKSELPLQLEIKQLNKDYSYIIFTSNIGKNGKI